MAQHPYFPQNVSIPDFVPNEKSLPDIVVPFAGTITIVLVASVILSKRVNPNLGLADLGQVCWFVQSGYLHLFFEGYLVLNHGKIPSSKGLFAQLWKEYSLSDSRYLTSDTFVISIETITVLFWGPCCIATAFCIATRNNLRYPLSVITCIAHLYGVALYYATSFAAMHMKGVAHSRPEFLYFWVYFVGMNLPWAVVPSVILWTSIRRIRHSLDLADRTDPSYSDLRSSTWIDKKSL